MHKPTESEKEAQRVYADAWLKYVDTSRWRWRAKRRAFVEQNRAWAEYQKAARGSR